MCASISPNSGSLMRLTDLPFLPLTRMPSPGVTRKLSGLAGSNETDLAAIQSPAGLRQPARSLPLNRSTAGLAGGARVRERAAWEDEQVSNLAFVIHLSGRQRPRGPSRTLLTTAGC